MENTMKKNTLILAAALLATSAAAHASESTTLEVTGQVVPSACSIKLGGDGTAAFGLIDVNKLSKDKATKLGEKSIDLSVDCHAPTKFAISAVDDRASTVVPDAAAAVGRAEFAYGLGRANGKNLGAYTIGFMYGNADGKALRPMISTVAGTEDWSRAFHLQPGDGVRTTWQASNSGVSNMTRADVKLSVTAALAPTSELDLGNGVSLDGKATIVLHYL